MQIGKLQRLIKVLHGGTVRSCYKAKAIATNTAVWALNRLTTPAVQGYSLAHNG